MFRLEKAIEPQMLEGNLSPAGVSPAEIEAAFDYSIDLVDDSKKANVIAAKAIAYVSRGEFARAYQIVTQAGYGPASRADELNRVKTLIERKIAGSELSRPCKTIF